jgi:hypothetical protein
MLEFEPYIYESVANKLSISSEQVEKIIEDCIQKYHLFVANGTFFWSERVNRNIEKRKKISKIKSKAGLASAEQRRKDRNIAEIATGVEHVLTGVEHVSTKKERKK